MFNVVKAALSRLIFPTPVQEESVIVTQAVQAGKTMVQAIDMPVDELVHQIGQRRYVPVAKPLSARQRRKQDKAIRRQLKQQKDQSQ